MTQEWLEKVKKLLHDLVDTGAATSCADEGPTCFYCGAKWKYRGTTKHAQDCSWLLINILHKELKSVE